MGKIYSPPEGFQAPDFSAYPGNYDEYHKACEDYKKSLKKVLRDSYKDQCPEAGKEIRFQVADGYARYIVCRLKPVELVHIDTDDNYHFEYAHRLTAKDIREQIRKEEALNRLFSSKKKEAAK